MAVKIRLRRVGRKKAPMYRIVVADSKSPRDGKFIEIIGQYAPRQSAGEGGLSVQTDRALAAPQGRGAQDPPRDPSRGEAPGRRGAAQRAPGRAVRVTGGPA